MGRVRFQEGALVIVGKGAKARYCAMFRVYDEAGGSRRKKVTIGLVSKLSKREAIATSNQN
jgi:hypothetical protein